MPHHAGGDAEQGERGDQIAVDDARGRERAHRENRHVDAGPATGHKSVAVRAELGPAFDDDAYREH